MLDPRASRFGQSAILSGLMDAEGLIACWEAIPPAKRDAPEHIDRRLARQAVQSQALTLWQAQQLLLGRTSGFQVDRYTLLELIGQGGMGRVYRARDTRLNRQVALKILAPERINNPRAVARFQREARVGAQLQHENLVRVYDFGESSGRFFLVMEYIEGQTIGSLLSKQGPMPPATAARLVRQVAVGLEHAHRKGLIHRDVNPYNIMVTHDGVAKLADLGLAIDLADGDRVTRDGATVGTFDYVAPEQARHSHLADIRSDIYSLGCTLYHMLSGHVPFPSPSLPEKLFSHQAIEPTPIAQVVPSIPPGLAEVVATMMRKQPEERYATPMQVAQALEPFIDDGAAVARGEPDQMVSPPPMPTPRSGSAEAPLALALAVPGPGGAGEVPATGAGVSSGSGTHGLLGLRASPTELEPNLANSAAPVANSAAPVANSAAPVANSAMPVANSAVPVTPAASTGPRVPRAPAAAALADTVEASPARSDIAEDEANLPLLTPSDDVDRERSGLPIVLDLGNEPLLRPPSRLRRSSESRDTRAAGPDVATTEVADRKETLGGRLALSAWWARGPMIAAAAVAAVAILVLLAGRFAMGPKPPPHPGDTRKGSEEKNPALPTRSKDALVSKLMVGSHRRDFDDEGDVPARTLIEAVRLAMGRGGGKEGYVELYNREPLRLEPGDFLDVRTASGTLEIRAAAGIQPVIEVPMDAGRPFLATGSNVSLRLSGLTLRARYSSSKPAAARRPLIEAAGRARIERCAFEVVGHQRPGGCRALFMDGGSLVLDRCWFEGFDEAIQVRVFGTTTTRISRTMVVPGVGTAAMSGTTPELRGWPIGLELLPGSNPSRRLTLDHCTFEGARLLAVTGQAGAGPLPVEIKQCAVRADSLLAWSPHNASDPLKVDLLWQGLGNHYQILGRTWLVPSPSAPTAAPAPPEIPNPAAWGKFVVKESGPIETRILFHTLPDARPNPPRPEDFAIESNEPPAARAGADPSLVGPGGK
ncbi:MAG: serine/threonine-protein kinase [Isosphaeraceae bacterium]